MRQKRASCFEAGPDPAGLVLERVNLQADESSETTIRQVQLLGFQFVYRDTSPSSHPLRVEKRNQPVSGGLEI